MAWRWPWQRQTQPERRDSGGAFYDRVRAAIEAEAAGTAADTGATAAVEAAAGSLSRAFASAELQGPAWAVEAVPPATLGQIGRDLMRRGESLHAIRMAGGMPRLIPCDSWHWQGGTADPDTWQVRATAYGPSSSTTWHLPASSVVWVAWGARTGAPYQGVGPTAWASVTARLQAQAERSLADESGGPLAQMLAIPADGGDGGDDDPLAGLKVDITRARGRAAFLETTAAGWGEGRDAAPGASRDWKANRLGPNPPAAFVTARRDAFASILAATGTPPALFMEGADGTAQREALRRWHLGTVLPLARLVEAELSRKLAAAIRLKFDGYALDQVSRATVVQKLVAAGVQPGTALAAVGMEGE